MIAGPGPCDDDALQAWLDGGCRGPAPVRQGFAAALTRPDGTAVVASSSRWEQAVLYAVADARVVVGIHPGEVIRRLPQPPPLDVAKLADLVALHDDPERTTFEGVRRLPFGGALHLGPGAGPNLEHRIEHRIEHRVEQWWQPDTEQDHRIRPADAPGLVRAAVRSAVEASLPPDGDVAATLSGGLDSSMVVGTAASLLAPRGGRILALTHSPLPGTPEPGGRWEVDDAPYAAGMARELPGIDWEPVVNTDLVTPVAADEWALRRTWQPSFNPINQVWINEIVRRAEAAGAPVLLTGASGNATFSRDADGILLGLVRARRLGAVLRQVRARHRAGSSWPEAGRSVAREGLPPRVLAWARRRRGIAAPDTRGPLGTADLPLRRERVSPAALAQLPLIEGDVPPDRQAWLDFVLANESRVGTVQNLSATVWWSDPLSDPEVVGLALRLPEEAWLADGWERGLARAAGEGIVPDAIRLRPTYGAQSGDVASWVAGQEQSYRDLLDRLRASPSVPEFVDLDALEAGIGRGLADPATAVLWQNVFGRAFALGRFAVWYEDEVLGRA